MIVAVSDWPEAAVAIAGISMITVIISVVVWQILATGRAGLSAKREGAYRRLAEETAELQRSTVETLSNAAAELNELNRRTAELERVLKEVE